MGRQFGYFTQLFVGYDYEKLSSTGFSLTGATATNKISSITPSITYNRIDNPYRPSRGYSAAFATQVAGGPLGGDTSYYKPSVTGSWFRPLKRRNLIALHAEFGLIAPWEGGTLTPGTVNGVPRFQRFWLGGETQGPRVFETRSITPFRYVRLDPFGNILETTTDPTGRPVRHFDRNFDGVVNQFDLVEMGGDRFFLLQNEYVYRVTDPVEVAFFLDVGNTLFEDDPWGFEGARISAGIELRFYLPVFPVPLRLIYGTPIQSLPEDRTSAFTFSIGKSF
jgi:outer membrane protein assembly factor BamA